MKSKSIYLKGLDIRNIMENHYDDKMRGIATAHIEILMWGLKSPIPQMLRIGIKDSINPGKAQLEWTTGNV